MYKKKITTISFKKDYRKLDMGNAYLYFVCLLSVPNQIYLLDVNKYEGCTESLLNFIVIQKHFF